VERTRTHNLAVGSVCKLRAETLPTQPPRQPELNRLMAERWRDTSPPHRACLSIATRRLIRPKTTRALCVAFVNPYRRPRIIVHALAAFVGGRPANAGGRVPDRVQRPRRAGRARRAGGATDVPRERRFRHDTATLPLPVIAECTITRRVALSRQHHLLYTLSLQPTIARIFEFLLRHGEVLILFACVCLLVALFK